MFDIKALKDAKKDLQTTSQDRDEKFSKCLSKANTLLNDFAKTNNEKTLKYAGLKYLECLNFNKRNEDVYFKLSYIFYLFGLIKESRDYFSYLEKLNPNYPNMDKLKLLLKK